MSVVEFRKCFMKVMISIALFQKFSRQKLVSVVKVIYIGTYEGGSICNENLFVTPSPNALGFYVICQTKDQSIAFIMVQETLFYLSKFNKLQTF